MVAKINENTDQKANSNHSLFVLDIFGFEAFEENVFEQFCINYANGKRPILLTVSILYDWERLQHEFNGNIDEKIFVSQNIKFFCENKTSYRFFFF